MSTTVYVKKIQHIDFPKNNSLSVVPGKNSMFNYHPVGSPSKKA